MPTLLRIDSSADERNSRSRALADAFASAWESRGEGFRTVVRDLHADPPPHLTTTAQHWPERLRGGTRLPESTAELQRTVIGELLAADVLVIGAPMYNYCIPSTLKAWIDLIHVPGVTAPFDVPTQPLAGRPAVILTARGGSDDGVTDESAIAPLRLVLGTSLGMDVRVVSVTRTLADALPDLGARRAEAELRAGLEEARHLATVLG